MSKGQGPSPVPTPIPTCLTKEVGSKNSEEGLNLTESSPGINSLQPTTTGAVEPSDLPHCLMGLSTAAYLSSVNDATTKQFGVAASKAFINGKPTLVVFDTGASATFITAHTAELFGLVTRGMQPLAIHLANQEVIYATKSCRARLRVLTSGAKPRYHHTQLNAIVLPPPGQPVSAAQPVGVYLGTDWLHHNRAKLDFSSVPFSVSCGQEPASLHSTICHDASACKGASVAALSPLTTTPDPLSLLTSRQCKRLLKDKATRRDAFIVMVCAKQTKPTCESIAAVSRGFDLLPYSVGTGSSIPCAQSVHLSSAEQPDKCLPALPVVGDGPVDTEQFNSLLAQYSDLFAEPKDMPPHRDLNGPIIPLIEGATPQFVRGKRLSPAELSEVNSQVTDLLAKGYIKPSSSPWGAPVLFIPKKDGGMRMAIDYRKLNNLTHPNRWPLPNITDLLEQVREAKVFSLMDLRSGYHQLRLAPEDEPKTAFITPGGLYEFTVLPFGLSNAPSVFTKYMSTVLGKYLGKFVIVYIDDILVYSNSPEEHLHHLKMVLDLLRQHKLFAKPSKCLFNRSELKYLGFVVGHGQLKVDPEKIDVVAKWQIPVYPKELQSFLGLANYFSKFLQGYSSLAAPLTALVTKTAPKSKRQKGIPYTSDTWLPVHTAAFEAIKQALCSAPVLVLPDSNKPYRLIADASDLGTGAVLMQDDHPIAYLSHKFSPTEANYHTGERELLAVIIALKKWRCYLQGCPGGLTLTTDHHPLKYLQTQPHLSPKQARWSQYLACFMPFQWEYIEGRLNVADPLSRHPSLNSLTVQRIPARQPAVQGPVEPTLLQKIKDAYALDDWFADSLNTANLQFEQGLWKGTGSDDSCPFRRKSPSAAQLVVPDVGKLKEELLYEFHDAPSAGHPGPERTLELIARHYWWPGMMLDVHAYVRSCASCQKCKSSNRRRAPLEPLPIPVRKWESVSMDFVTCLPKVGRIDAILVVVDRLTKFVVLIPTTAHVTAKKAAELFVNRVVCRVGLPADVVSDRDPRFTAAFYKSVMLQMGTRQAMSTAYHPQTDGQTERMNRLVEETLRHYVLQNQSNWVSLLPMCEFAINNAYSSAIHTSPFYLNLGQYPRVPATLEHADAPEDARSYVTKVASAIKLAQEAMQKAHDRMRARYTAVPLMYAPSQSVLLSTKYIAGTACLVFQAAP